MTTREIIKTISSMSDKEISGVMEQILLWKRGQDHDYINSLPDSLREITIKDIPQSRLIREYVQHEVCDRFVNRFK